MTRESHRRTSRDVRRAAVWLVALIAGCGEGVLYPGAPAPDGGGLPPDAAWPGPDAAVADAGGTTQEAGPQAPDLSVQPHEGTRPPDSAPPPSGLTSCANVAHIGDSLTYYTRPELSAAYLDVGATAQIDAYGGRAVLQKLAADPHNGRDAAQAIRAAGFSGCWVVALGINDTANVAAGAGYTRAHAIDEMLKAIDPAGAAPVMWINCFTERTSGYYSNANMILWNQELVAAQGRWSNLRVFDWAAQAATGAAPFADGIHHTTAGYAVRNAAIAEALVRAYPAP